MDIREVARRSGVPASTLRFYEEKGLIASNGRRGLRRVLTGRCFWPRGGTKQDNSQASRHARRPTARRRLPRAEPHGNSFLPPHPAGGRVGNYWSTEKKEFHRTVG
jgi:MerR family regulatory protein